MNVITSESVDFRPPLYTHQGEGETLIEHRRIENGVVKCIKLYRTGGRWGQRLMFFGFKPSSN